MGSTSDVSKRDKWLWNYWRTSHPGVVIDDFTLAKKTWNFNDWTALNARWRDLHLRLDPQPTKSQESGKRMSGERNPKAISAPPPKVFTLDMEKVYAITNETKEVVAILSVLMEDEPAKAITLPTTVAMPVPEIPKVPSDGKKAPQVGRFGGLDAAFHPILERLLSRDSWPASDFNALAREFHFMPLNIRDTLNDWAAEALGDFILEGEDPVLIRRDLIAKEMIYG